MSLPVLALISSHGPGKLKWAIDAVVMSLPLDESGGPVEFEIGA